MAAASFKCMYCYTDYLDIEPIPACWGREGKHPHEPLIKGEKETAPKIKILTAISLSDNVRATVQARAKNRLAKKQFHDICAPNLEQRLAISGKHDPTGGIYYRKMSEGEYNDLVALKKTPLDVATKHTDKPKYRYWISSSLAKVKAFGNSDAGDDGNLIVKLEFSVDLLANFEIAAHQKTGVQSEIKTVAVHREGFAELDSFDNVGVKEVRENKLDHNLGFTQSHSKQFKEFFESATKVDK